MCWKRVTIAIRFSLPGSVTNGLRTALDTERLSLWERQRNIDGGVSEGYIKTCLKTGISLHRGPILEPGEEFLAANFGRLVKEGCVRGVSISVGSRWWNLEGGFLLWEL